MTEQVPMTHRTCGETRTSPMEMEVTSLPVKYGRALTPSPQRCRAASRTRMEMPMVMMIILRTDGLTSQRMKSTSMRAPTAMVAATAARMAAGSGRKALKVTAVMPPSMTNSPWAKLMIPVVL